MIACQGRALAVRPLYCPVMFRANNGVRTEKSRLADYLQARRKHKKQFRPNVKRSSRRVPRFAATARRRLAPTAPGDAGSFPRASRRPRGAGAAGVDKKARCLH